MRTSEPEPDEDTGALLSTTGVCVTSLEDRTISTTKSKNFPFFHSIGFLRHLSPV